MATAPGINFQQYLDRAHTALRNMNGRTFDIFTLRKPKDTDEATAIAKVISKLSPFTANVLEAELIYVLNHTEQWPQGAKWMRQDPDFPDAILSGVGTPIPGIELKMWFPLATEITARFRETQAHLIEHNTSVALIAWLPEFILFGQPKIIGVWIDDALTVAQARDIHSDPFALYPLGSAHLRRIPDVCKSDFAIKLRAHL